ncbi:hypothetical protein [Pseudomonas sp. HLT2-19-2]
MRYDTRSVMGRTRKANHDCAGALCDDDRGLFVITDGTSKPGSGQLAECFVKGVLAAYPKHIDQGGDITEHGAVEQVLSSVLAELHPTLFADFVFHPLSVGARLVFVTDGFWAELTESQQSSLLAAPDSDFIAVEDDVTWIDVHL